MRSAHFGSCEGTSYFIEKISGASLHYSLAADHPLIGHSAPDLAFEDGSRLGDLLHDGTGLLLDLQGRDELRTLSQEWAGRLKYAARRAEDNKGLSAFLVRPHGFVAWATDTEPDMTALEETLRAWFGRPV